MRGYKHDHIIVLNDCVSGELFITFKQTMKFNIFLCNHTRCWIIFMHAHSFNINFVETSTTISPKTLDCTCPVRHRFWDSLTPTRETPGIELIGMSSVPWAVEDMRPVISPNNLYKKRPKPNCHPCPSHLVHKNGQDEVGSRQPEEPTPHSKQC